MSELTLFGLQPIINQPRDHNGQFTEYPLTDIKKLIRQHLESGLSLTGLQALKLFRTIRLAVYIQRLKKDGLLIQDKWIKENGKMFKRYWIK